MVGAEWSSLNNATRPFGRTTRVYARGRTVVCASTSPTEIARTQKRRQTAPMMARKLDDIRDSWGVRRAGGMAPLPHYEFPRTRQQGRANESCLNCRFVRHPSEIRL